MFNKKVAKSTQGPENSVKVSVKEAGACERELSVEVGEAGIAPIRSEVVREFRRQAKVDGSKLMQIARNEETDPYKVEDRLETIARTLRRLG